MMHDITDDKEIPKTCSRCGTESFGARVEYCCGVAECEVCACCAGGGCNYGEGEHMHACCSRCGFCFGAMECATAEDEAQKTPLI